MITTTHRSLSLQASTWQRDLDRVEDILEGGMDVNIRDEYAMNVTPLHYAVAGNHPEIVTLLMNYGANPNLEDDDGVST